MGVDNTMLIIDNVIKDTTTNPRTYIIANKDGRARVKTGRKSQKTAKDSKAKKAPKTAKTARKKAAKMDRKTKTK